VKYKAVNHPASNVLLILAQNPYPAPSFGKYQAKPASLAPTSRYIDSSSFVSPDEDGFKSIDTSCF
jgi:hypothetical protein